MDAILFATFIRNRSPRKLDGKTPIELLTGKRPTFKYMHRFGATYYGTLDKAQRNGQTLGPKAIKGRLMAHLDNGYLIEKENLKRIASVHVKFMKSTERDEVGDLGIETEDDADEKTQCTNEHVLPASTPASTPIKNRTSSKRTKERDMEL
jgi:hypothetical protein